MKEVESRRMHERCECLSASLHFKARCGGCFNVPLSAWEAGIVSRLSQGPEEPTVRMVSQVMCLLLHPEQMNHEY